ncbi:MAG: hypothetical protein QM680_13585 [Luteolibacter sp.]
MGRSELFAFVFGFFLAAFLPVFQPQFMDQFIFPRARTHFEPRSEQGMEGFPFERQVILGIPCGPDRKIAGGGDLAKRHMAFQPQGFHFIAEGNFSHPGNMMHVQAKINS